MRKICVVTGSRAEYGLLYWLLKAIQEEQGLSLQLLVTGMHLSPEFGLTWQHIAADGFAIDRKIEILLSSDTSVGISKAMGLGLISFAEAFSQLQPDIVVVLGDRFEVFVAVQAAMLQSLAIAHIHGGELTEGVIDDAMRHAITKMAHLHFTATETYRRRVIQLGEQPEHVYNVGAPGLDNIDHLPLLTKIELEQNLGFTFHKRNILVTFHPVILAHNTPAEQFDQLLLALDDFQDSLIIFTHSNADLAGRIINQMIENYRQSHVDHVYSFVSLGSIRYLSLLRQVDVVLGNSSSGIIEAPSCKVATINIGDRQKGRLAANSVLHTPVDATAIKNALKLVFSEQFTERFNQLENPYGQGGASWKIKDILKQVSLPELLKKQFYDIADFKVLV